MFKVLIWDYTGESSQWLDSVADKNDIEIVGTITPEKSVPEILLNREAWDWLLVFEQGARQFFNATLQLLKLPPDKVIYALDTNSWLQHPKAIYNILNNSRGVIRRWHDFLNFRKQNDFITCTVEELNYIATSNDDYVIRHM